MKALIIVMSLLFVGCYEYNFPPADQEAKNWDGHRGKDHHRHNRHRHKDRHGQRNYNRTHRQDHAHKGCEVGTRHRRKGWEAWSTRKMKRYNYNSSFRDAYKHCYYH